MSPLISLLEKETKSYPTRHEHLDAQENISSKGCGTGKCTCLKPCANCTCRDKKKQ